jgi:hypothetical protein
MFASAKDFFLLVLFASKLTNLSHFATNKSNRFTTAARSREEARSKKRGEKKKGKNREKKKKKEESPVVVFDVPCI